MISDCLSGSWLVFKAFDLLERDCDCIELYGRRRSLHIHDGVEEVVWSEYLLGRIGFHDMIQEFGEDKLLVVKDVDVFDYRLDSIGIPQYIVDLSSVCFMRLPERFELGVCS